MLGQRAPLPGSRDRDSLKPLLIPKSINTHQGQEPSMWQVFFWPLLSLPQGFFCFLKKHAGQALRDHPQHHGAWRRSHHCCWAEAIKDHPEKPARQGSIVASGAGTDFITGVTTSAPSSHTFLTLSQKMRCLLLLVSPSQTAHKNTFGVLVFRRL